MRQRARLCRVLCLSHLLGACSESGVEERTVPIEGGLSRPERDGAPPREGRSDASAACQVDSLAASTTWIAPRRVSPWDFVPSADAARDGGIDAGLSDAARSACAAIAPGQQFGAVHCEGPAVVRRPGGALFVELGDGSRLVWDEQELGSHVRPPAVEDGESVWIDFTHDVRVVCPFCGTYYNDELVIRAGHQGELLFVAREGHKLTDVDAALVEEVFGVGAHQVPSCTLVQVQKGCQEVTRVRFDHVLESDPEQVFEHARPLHGFITPSGELDVIWAFEEVTRRFLGSPVQCSADGPDLASDTAFAVSRVGR